MVSRKEQFTLSYSTPDETLVAASLRDEIIGDDVTDVIITVNYVVACGVISLIGIAANLANVVVFASQGLKDSVNVGLLGLAVSDIFSLAFLLADSVCFNPLFLRSDLPVEMREVEYVVGGWPHTCFTRVTSWITAMVTLERCLCVASPLRVKSVFSALRTKIAIVFIFLFVGVSAAPEFYVNQLAWQFSPGRNRTVLGMLYLSNRDQIEDVTTLFNNIVLQYATFIVVVAATVVLVVKLHEKSRWRSGLNSGNHKSDNPDQISKKDKRVAKMIGLVSAVFIGSYLPSSILFMVMLVIPKFHPSGYYNLFYVIWSWAYVAEGLNSTCNILIYLKMSSKFRAKFSQIFLRYKYLVDNNNSQ